MEKIRYKYLGKSFYLLSVVYVYLFIMLDILRLNPDDDGDLSFSALFPPMSLFMISTFYYIFFDNTSKKHLKIKKLLHFTIFLSVIPGIFLFVSNLIYGELGELVFMFYSISETLHKSVSDRYNK